MADPKKKEDEGLGSKEARERSRGPPPAYGGPVARERYDDLTPDRPPRLDPKDYSTDQRDQYLQDIAARALEYRSAVPAEGPLLPGQSREGPDPEYQGESDIHRAMADARAEQMYAADPEGPSGSGWYAEERERNYSVAKNHPFFHIMSGSGRGGNKGNPVIGWAEGEDLRQKLGMTHEKFMAFAQRPENLFPRPEPEPDPRPPAPYDVPEE